MTRRPTIGFASSWLYLGAVLLAWLYAIARLLLQAAAFAGAIPAAGAASTVPLDFGVYLAAGQRVLAGQALYPDSTHTLQTLLPYLYSPSFAGVMALLVSVFPPSILVYLSAIGHLLAYGWLYQQCRRLFLHTGAQEAAARLRWLLPLWLIALPFWADLTYLNVRVFLAVLQVGLLAALLREQLGRAAAAALVLLLMTPQWALLILLPLVLRRYRFFARLACLVLVGYLVVAGITIYLLGPGYGIAQYQQYALLLSRLGAIYPWRSAADGVFGPNHALTQLVTYVLSDQPLAFVLATLLKGVLLAPLIWLARAYMRPGAHGERVDVQSSSEKEMARGGPRFVAGAPVPAPAMPQAALAWGLALILAAWVIVDLVWSDSFFLVLVFLAYFAPHVAGCAWPIRAWMWAICIVYALGDVFRLVGFALLGADVFLPYPSFSLTRTDPGAYVPLALLVILTFYGMALWLLWRRRPQTPFVAGLGHECGRDRPKKRFRGAV